MNTKRFFLGMAGMIATIAMFTACSQNEAEDIAPINKSNVISLTSSMETMRAASELQTNALSTSVKVGAFGVSGSATITNGNNNEYTVGTNGTLTATNEMAWPSDASAKVNIYAYAPYQSNWTYNSANAFSVQTDQSSDANYLASDLLYAKATDKTQTTEAIALNFTHKLSRINVTIKKGEDASTITLNGAKVYITNTYIATTLNPSTGALAETPSTAADILIGTLSAEPTATGTTLYGITIPQAIAAATKLVKVTTTDKVYVAKLGSATTLEGGKSYNFTATIGTSTEATLTLGSVTLTGWGDATDLGSATMEEAAIEPITANFDSPGSSASYSSPTYTWTATNNNLMTCFEFTNGELANYTKLTFKINNLTGGMVRMGYYVGSNFTEFGNGYGSNGTKTVDLTALGIDLSTVTKISFGGRTINTGFESGSCDILASEVVLSKE